MDVKSAPFNDTSTKYTFATLSYVALSIISIALSSESGMATIWFSNAALLIFILRDEKRMAWGYLLVCLFSAFISNVLMGTSVSVSLGLAISNVIEILPIILLRLSLPESALVGKIGLEFLRILIYATLGCILAALVAGMVLFLAYHVEYSAAVIKWFAADFLALVAVAPLGISFTKQNWQEIIKRNRLIELTIFLVITVLLEVVVFVFTPFPFIIISLPLLISAFRLRFFGTAILCLIEAITFLLLEYRAEILIAGPYPYFYNYAPIIVSIILLSPLIIALLVDQYSAAMRESRKLSKELSYHTTHDSLTNLISRSEFERQVKEIIEMGMQEYTYLFCYLDLDRFKIINDTLGHAAGDELLRCITDVIQSNIRATDILARLGGDEFGIVFTNISMSSAIKICEKVISAIRSLKFKWDGKAYEVGVSIGMVHFFPGSTSFESLMAKADVACYTAKHQGGNTHAIYEDMKSEASLYHREIHLISGIKEAIEEDRFVLYIHEVKSLKKDMVMDSYHEILLRLIDGNKMVYPAQFISTAERYNLMSGIDQWVIRKVLIDYGAQLAGLSNFSFTINLSANSINSPYFIDFLMAVLEETPIPRSRIGFELTETAVINNLDKAGEILRMIQMYGSFIALDDFGSGLSSFNYLKYCPVKFVKIDGSFIRMVAKSAIDKSIVESINELAHKLGALTIAEYAESEEILSVLYEIGVDFAQGYAISRETPLVDLFVDN
ncbi:MAG: EAL domain-containing protein [Gammaproteobacteria bacterium]|nr:MAG: EAL domain-containing protein [Gammaproteobacteria bacterium]